ncbi:hypothetical protein HGQ17_05180 [Nesterenkonia sp. MY13]|uniref:Signal transduction histidine kinase subgroup 3 dimerisation and phosphoacceptor domain-containing protein n=1 Tax=Nesterenkonia sedimenti TaxID=1463632 RepID=A0A7X8TIK0_9MICC|nr:hypothetical protein [Nesterenkonia sedimenti]NLS09411.1 hypothetical protein [Nesterenkonia sedimenti]
MGGRGRRWGPIDRRSGVALAEKLIDSDPDRASEELREVHELVGSTITETKELAYAQRRLNLTSELENAKNLFEAGGIAVEVQRETEGQAEASPHNELLGQVLREATTNILRHAQSTRVRIRLSEQWISITNDGADSHAQGKPQLRGLENLRQRVTDSGGRLRVESDQGRFLTEASFAPDGGAVR